MTKNTQQFKVNKLALALIAVMAPMSFNAIAQTNDKTEVIEIKGIKGSLVQSLNNKRFDSSVVDGISAEDIGKFPDQNVAESLQRITGVTIDRSAGEGTTVSIRGFGPEFNTVTLNNRVVPTDNGGRAFSFDLLASELISGADVYKTAEASRVEGSIGGLVNVKTAKPLDLEDVTAAGSIKGVYDSLVGKTNPSLSALVGKNFDDKFGILATFAYQQRDARADRISVGGYRRDTVITSNDPNAANPTVSDPVWRPQSAVQSLTTQDRERIGSTITAQWAPSDNLVLTADLIYSALEVKDNEANLSRWFSNPLYNAVIDENDTVRSFTRVPKPLVSQGVYQLWDNGGQGPEVAGRALGTGQWNSSSQVSDSRDVETTVVGFNAKWQASDNLELDFDIHKSTTSARSGNNSRVTLANPTQVPTNFALSDEAFKWEGEEIDFVGLPTNYYANNVQFTKDDRDDDVFEFRLDASYSFDDMGPLASVDTGLYYSDREKIASNGENPFGLIVRAFSGFHYNAPASILSEVSPRGGFLSDQGGLVDNWLAYDVQDLVDFFSNPNSGVKDQVQGFYDQVIHNYENGATARDGSLLYGSRAEAEAAAEAARATALQKLEDAQAFTDERTAGNPLGIFAPVPRADKSWRVNEQTQAFYLQANLEGDSWSGNIGARYITTETESFGSGSIVSQIDFDSAGGGGSLTSASGQNVSDTSDYNKVLPSANFRYEIGDDILLRLGYSKTLTRPQLSSLRPTKNFSGRLTREQDGNISFDGTINGQNINLRPYLSTNIDASLEWYYSDDSAVTLAYFDKSIKDWIATGSQTTVLSIPYFIDGVNTGNQDFTFEETLPINIEDSDAKGIELAVLHAFDNGFGLQANYTYMDSSSAATPGEVTPGALAGLSKDSVNLIGFYESGPFQARLAYNWRSDYVNCATCSRNRQPVQTEAYGQFDASASYDINENISVFVEAVNLTDEDRRQYSTFTSRFLSYEDTGARFSLGVRASF
ncbi:TonB-dependent receptor [Agaribacter marinus]|uniref:TonB-dependent receptor n=1 Tax=Agaribacter marinus TaxID=1431249 RepID=A0AA37SZH9_9ALTE|nr:TonB-dependent receptor [Agaribacter marinus]GLR72613.1 hypothetical protein GCM10007852_35210 [Agaribacter marinus]